MLELLRNRLLHFAVLGGAIFALAPQDPAGTKITIDREVLDSLEAAEARRLGVPELNAPQKRAVANRAVEDEVLYREALRLGLDDGDPAVRQRLILKALFLAEEMAGANEPIGREELEAHWAEYPDRWRAPMEISFMHVFASSESALAKWKPEIAQAPAERAPLVGEPFPLSRDVPFTPLPRLKDGYGASLTDALAAAPIGEWIGPIASKHGWHFAKVTARNEATIPPLGQIGRAVESDLRASKKQRAIREYLERSFARYEVEIAGRELQTIAETARVAPEVEVD